MDRTPTNIRGRAPLIAIKPAPVNVEDWTTLDFLHAIGNKFPDACTVYGMAKRLKVTRQTVHRYLDNRGTFDAEVALRVAELIPDAVDAGTLLVITARERERQSEAKEHWNAVLRKLRDTARHSTPIVCAFALALAALPDPEPVASAMQSVAASTMYIMLNQANGILTSIPAAVALLVILCALTGRARLTRHD